MKAAKWMLPAMVALAWALAGCGGKTRDGAAKDTEIVGEATFKPVTTLDMKSMEVNCGNNVKMKLVLIPKGRFLMGAPETEKGSLLKERPTREVTLTRPFWLGVTEVTQAQYEAVMGVNPSPTKGANHPVGLVSWNQARQFCQRLSDKTKRTFRLPTEAEWEYACRAGTQTPWFWGDSSNDIVRYAVCKTNAAGSSVTSPVATKLPNPWGLYDIIGNVWELCSDGDSGGYDINDTIDPTGNKNNPGIKVARGGSMNYDSDLCRAAYRLAQGVDITLYETGFRVVCDVE